MLRALLVGGRSQPSGALREQLHGEGYEHGPPHDEGQEGPGEHNGGHDAFPIHLPLIGSARVGSGRVRTPCELGLEGLA